ncbi:MAG: PLDc_N domain-containing protein [Anaerolineae bacterium]|nr:PLDc_N domain-containing protein [Anaerolineae bacterium]
MQISDQLAAQLARYIPLLIPILLLELGLMVFALIDLSNRAATRGPKWAWILVIVLINVIGPILYLLFGRQEE